METLPTDLCVNNETNLCIKKYSLAKDKFFYKPKDPEYFINWRKNHKVMVACEHCNSTVVERQMKIHQRTMKCELSRFKKNEELKN